MYSSKILDDIKNIRIKSSAEIMMRFELMGKSPDWNFINSIVGMLIFGGETADNACKILCEFVKKDLYVDLFRNNDMVANLVSYLVNYMRRSEYRFLETNILHEHAKKVLDEISKKRPGIVIGYYLNNRNLFNPSSSAYDKSMEPFEEYVMRLSEKLAGANPEYRERYHKRVVSAYHEDLNIALAMR